MPSFVFWNAQRQSRLGQIAQLATDYNASFVILAEGTDSSASILQALSAATGRTYHYASDPNDRVRLFTRFGASLIKRLPVYRDDKVIAFKIDLPLTLPLLVAAVHLRSKMHGNDEVSQLGYARLAREEIQHHETSTGVDRTVVIGDFNMDPYEPGMVSVDGFHALMDRRSVLAGPRRIGSESFDAFYNPMWSLMGDLFSSPAGSFHRLGSRRSPRWHLFDQVILRPGLVPALVPHDLEIIASSAFRTKMGIPGSQTGSDHFPLRFTLNV